MEHSKHRFTQEELRQANTYITAYDEKLNSGYGIASAMKAAKHIVLQEVVNSAENVQTSGGAFRAAVSAIEDGLPQAVTQMYDEAYADNVAFDAANA